MDLSYSKEEVAFRQEVRDFFQTSVPAETRKKLQEGRHLSKEDMVTGSASSTRRAGPFRIGRRSGAAPAGMR